MRLTLSYFFVHSNSFISELQNASSSPRSHQGDQGGAEEVVVTVVRRQLLISTPVLHGTIYMAHATSSISAEQVPSIFLQDFLIELLNLATMCYVAMKQ